jgi:hypothetical protein
MAGDVCSPDECVGLTTASRMHTIHGAFASFEEGFKGSLELVHTSTAWHTKGTQKPNAAAQRPSTAGPNSYQAQLTPIIHCICRARCPYGAVSTMTARRACCQAWWAAPTTNR